MHPSVNEISIKWEEELKQIQTDKRLSKQRRRLTDETHTRYGGGKDQLSSDHLTSKVHVLTI